LETAAANSQVKVSVAGIDALCPTFGSCDYKYIANAGEITAQTLAGKALTITGTALPTPTKVTLGGIACAVGTKSATSITCTLAVSPPAGAWDANVQNLGSVPVKSGVAKIDVAVTVSGVTPNINLNQMGGDVLVIAGEGFDAAVMASNTVVLEDGTKCPVTATTPVEIKCRTEKIVKTTSADLAKNIKVKVTTNVKFDESQTIKVNTVKKSAESLSPTSVSPVLHTPIIITLTAAYTGTLVIADTTVILHGTDKAGKATTRKMYITKVDNAAAKKTIQIKFPGAVSGDYTLTVSTKVDGALDSTALNLKVIGEVTGFSPLAGSNAGGTLLTITGRHFSTNILDNPVTLGGAGSKGNIKCLLVSSKDTEIKCRIAATTAAAVANNDGWIIAFLKLSEETKCNASASNDCKMKWEAPPLDIQSKAVTFDATSKTYKLAITTTSAKKFTKDDTTGTELWLDGVKQTCDSVTDTVATFTITHLDAIKATTI